MAMRKRTIVAAVAGALLLLPIGAAMVALFAVDPNAYRGIMEEQAEDALGRQVTIAGDMEFGVGLTPTFVFTDVRIENLPGGSREHMARIERIVAEIELWPLIAEDRVRLDRLVLDGADLLLETGADGRPNWRFAGPAGGQPDTSPGEPGPGGSLPHLAAAEIRASQIVYSATGGRRTLAIDRAMMDWPAPGEPADWALRGTLDGQPLSVDLSTDSPRELVGRRDGPWPLSGTIALADATLAVEGSVAEPLRPAGWDVSIDLALPSGEAVAALTAGQPPGLPPLSLRARIADREDHIAVSDLRLEVRDTAIAGDLRVMPRRDPLYVEGSLSTGRLDPAGLAAGGPADARLVPDIPIPDGWLGTVDADLALEIDRLETGGSRIDAVSAQLRIDGQRLTLDLEQARLAGGRASGRLVADAAGDPPSVSLDLHAERLDVGGLLAPEAGGASLQGTLGLDVALDGSGATVREVVAGGSGRVDARLGRSTVASRYLELLGASLVSALVPRFEQRDGSTITCAVARLTLTGGALRTGDLVIDTPQATIAGAGGIDLLEERIDMVLRPQPKDVSLMPLTAPVRVHGPLFSPSYSVDPAEMALQVGGAALLSVVSPFAVLVPLVDPGSAEGNACAAALDDPRPAPRPDGLPQRLIEGAGSAAAGAGEAAGAIGRGVGEAAGAAGRAAGEAGRGVGEAVGGAAEEAGRAIDSLFGD
jgi:hypothetical protein